MVAYLDLAAFTVLTVMPSTEVAALEALEPGWVDGQLEHYSRAIDARLRKRYAVPFAAPPAAVKEWLARLVTVRAYVKRGVNPLDEQFVDIKGDRDEALAEIKEAAESVDGLFDLPADDTADGSAIEKGAPFGYSEASPYVWMDEQAETGRQEDRSGGGTSG